MTDLLDTMFPAEHRDAMLAAQAAVKPHVTERVKVCKFCGADVRGYESDLHIARGYERGDGMWIEEMATNCCNHHAPYRNGSTPLHWKWIARTVEADRVA